MENHLCNPAPPPDQNPDGKTWNPIFSKINRKKFDSGFHKCRQDSKVKLDLLDTFLQDTDNAVPSREVEQARNFFQNGPQGEIAQRFQRAWVECRRKSIGGGRTLPEWLNSDQLSRFLEDREDWTDVQFVLALARTASWNEVLALRAVVRQRIARTTSIQVHIAPTGYLTFRLVLSLPHLVLRRRSSSPVAEADARGHAQYLTTDLSFLNMEATTGGGPARYSIRKAHDTVLICGCDNTYWTGYALSDYRPTNVHCGQTEDSGISPEGAEEEEEGDNDDEEEMPDEDFFASEGSNQVLDADNTEWDPRTYFLRVMAIRVGKIRDEYEYFIETLKKGIEDWMANRIYTKSPHTQHHEASNKRLLADTLQIKQVLLELRAYLKLTVRVWKRFSAADGDKCYFADVTRVGRLVLRQIEEIFADLSFREENLDLLERLCEEAERALIFRMNEQTLELNLQINRLSKRTTTIASESQKAAEETSRTTLYNVQLLLTTTPFVIALTYFCSEQNLFSINRTPTTFWICFFVLLFALPLITLIVEQCNQLKKILYEKCIRSTYQKLLQIMGREIPQQDTVDVADLDFDTEQDSASKTRRRPHKCC
ncbi:Nn.00g100080.m01.CDS01 [Neocucurbitaria sp. VM-36]